MWLAFYNPKHVGEVLLLTRGPLADDLTKTESVGAVTFIKHKDTQELLGINLFDLSGLDLEGQGQVFLTADQVAIINEKLAAADSQVQIEVDHSEKFVVGYVESCEPVEGSDHLILTQTRVSDDKVLQIVCGASNVRQGLKVLVAQEGAVMPNGLIIWAGELRGEASQGMICSTDELELTHLEVSDGIWELPSHFEVGTPLDQVVANY